MPLSSDASRFAAIPFLSHLDAPALEALAFSSETRIMRRGDFLFRRGEPGDCAYVLLNGRVGLEMEAGGPPVFVEPGSLIGELALIVEAERRANAVVVEPSAVLRIGRDAFLKTLRDHPASAIRLRDYCAARLTEFTRELDAASRALQD